MKDVDYLVVGAGAMGMAFVDTLLSETDATVAMIDRYHQPGGHWTVAYPYVRLHQPSAFYGVGSTELGSGRVDEVGWNRGLAELATAGEICAYFDHVMQQWFLPSGRVDYHPRSEYEGDGRFRSLVTGERSEVRAGKIVDATYMNVVVPSMRPPAFEVAEGVACLPPNDLTTLAGPAAHYTVVGAGKTGVDACLWLLRNGVEPSALTWIMPRDAWYVDRARIQPGAAMARRRNEGLNVRSAAIAQATSIEDLFDRLCASGDLLRLSDEVRPSMFRCATVTQAELAQLRRIADVVRLGRVRRLGVAEIELDHGTAPARPGTVYVDCTADGLAYRPAVDVFDGDRITLQSIPPASRCSAPRSSATSRRRTGTRRSRTP
ncbi:NAD(P)/FAD-dependent oxidoreductase [Kutzneria sp. NPDC052558]|uniref:NAD(P)/FAD-dependent oxidoreductase n=1 Tax=Kutzneria sp. NPDC052558 TaxID=3364121 RepID=UPI0037C979CB